MCKLGWVNIELLRLCPHRVIFVVMNENPIASQLNPGDAAKCLARQAKESGVYFWRFRPGYVM